MMTLLPRNLPTSHTKARIGMLGGFFAVLLYYLGAEDGKRTHLHEYKLGRARDAPKESVEYRQYLLSNFEGRKYYEWEFPERRWLLRNVQKVDMWEREQ
jgi:hypothetical protein